MYSGILKCFCMSKYVHFYHDIILKVSTLKRLFLFITQGLLELHCKQAGIFLKK